MYIFISRWLPFDSLTIRKFLKDKRNMDEGSYTIGEFARRIKLSPRTIDYYTRQGLLLPEQPRRGHGYRHYREEDCRRVALIKRLQARKFSLQEIRQVLDSNGRQNIPPAVECMEQVNNDLERLRHLVQETRPSALAADQPAMRAVATEALQNATTLCSLLVSLLQDMPFL
ncbi:MAG: MerR family transcriptional regulator [Thermodesulfobacteriota bacterium]|jgi:DNA-binding transcriptional MerR regulator